MLVGHMPELVIVLVIALLVMGPGKLPSVAGALGKGIRDFKKEINDVTAPVRDAASLSDGEHINKV